ncbi:MAG TPA: ammonia-forming cytochrome c nitrite reductase subunit c552 [Verrucomicrobiae bacterium]|nr:ammonia-forming cytochrome c nitrite reductase subunit c552 [Verrucomicrobiae bacterium]
MQTGRHALGWTTAVLIVWLTSGAAALAEEVQHLSITQPGGMPGWPVITGIQRSNNTTKITWDGPSGYYQLYYKTNLASSTWLKLGSPNLNRTTNITSLHSNLFFRVAGPSPLYAGSKSCLECHANIHSSEVMTPHTKAFTSPAFVAAGGQTNKNCLACHTVGFGLPSGFKSASDFRSTNLLAGVQCESCHGPAGNHVANEMDLTARPRIDIASQVCGGCHSGSHNPTFEEWNSTAHAIVTEDMNLTSRINSCGRCHSGTARLAMVNGMSATTIANTLTNDANVAITCAVCHDPHSVRPWTNVLTGIVTTNQLRYPVASTNYFSLSTAATFTNRYDINICAQCHNDRGATWTSSSRPPHHSPQYNLLMGSVGINQNGANAATNATPAAHATMIHNQCVGCHMPHQAQGAGHAAMTGHSFKVETYESCLTCHPTNPEGLVNLTQNFVVKPRMQQVKAALDYWATTASPMILRTNYGALAWEYTTPGELSSGTRGPTDAQQALIPAAIKQARFNLYIVNNDGSFGVHNPLYTINLLDAAYYWAVSESFQ